MKVPASVKQVVRRASPYGRAVERLSSELSACAADLARSKAELELLRPDLSSTQQELLRVRAQMAAAELELNGFRNAAFEADDNPGGPRVLFIGSAVSSHTHSWIGLLDGLGFNVRLFSPFATEPLPPDDFAIRTYVTNQQQLVSNSVRKPLHIPPGEAWEPVLKRHVHAIIQTWRPHVIHTLGFFHSGRFYGELQREAGFHTDARWVLQLRGGSDLALNQFQTEAAEKVRLAASEADQIISDNEENFSILRGMGIDPIRFSNIGPVPGSGGMDVPMRPDWALPSTRRTILWPKAYNTQFAQAYPVLEAIRLAWREIQPCKIVMLWTVQAEVAEWLAALPPEIRAACDVRAKVPRNEVLRSMSEARVLLAPSLVDGRPNSMLEAMVGGAVPIVSPLATILEVAKHEENVLLARNLYPEEIAGALVRAMTDDALVDRIATRNLELVGRIANRAVIREQVVDLYARLAAEDHKTAPLQNA